MFANRDEMIARLEALHIRIKKHDTKRDNVAYKKDCCEILTFAHQIIIYLKKEHDTRTLWERSHIEDAIRRYDQYGNCFLKFALVSLEQAMNENDSSPNVDIKENETKKEDELLAEIETLIAEFCS